MVGVLGTAQAALTRANRELESRASELVEANRRLQVQMEERAKAEEALRQAQKMETIGQLTGGVAHDFNNLLTVILGNLDRLQRRIAAGSDPEELRRTAGNAIRGAERAAALTRSLLAFARRQPLNPKRVDVNKLVASMSEMLRRSLGEQVVIDAVVASGLWQTQVDPNQLESAILNLAVNARDAMPKGGKLIIETANGRLDDRSASEAEVTPGPYVVVSVTDTGTGMSKEVMARAFDPFFTTKDVGHGTGLGLSQVYGFVKQSGGHVQIDSVPGQGTTVRIYLPRLVGWEAEGETPSAPDISPGAQRTETVLVVEDNEDVREHSVAILAELGYRVVEAPNGLAALDILENRKDIALLFTDVGLPGGMNGRQLADEARRRRPDLRVLFTTGYTRDAIVHGQRPDEGVQLITKPFTHAELAAIVPKVLDRRAEVPCILVVEDEALVRMNTVDALQELGFRVEEAGTARQAMEKVRTAAGGIDAALIDIGLPDRRGDDLATDLRNLYGSMAIVIASGYGEQATAQRFSSDPRVRMLGKPYESARLIAVLDALGIRPPRPDTV
jgi:signal transduction histidine kinase/DNA-binding response OmpR family regulator